MSNFQRPRERIVEREVNQALVDEIAAQLSVSPVLATILVARGLNSFEDCRRFFNPDPADLHDPFSFSQMSIAVKRIGEAIDNAEPLTVYGDYDVDGITATALMVRVLRLLGAVVHYYLPNRLLEGYGLSTEGLDAIAANGSRLVVTVDCGVGAVKEIAYARSLGLEVIVTDHHEPAQQLPDALALLDPKLPASGYPDDRLAGVGVAFKLCQALCRSRGVDDEVCMQFVDLVAVGTAADIVPLQGENRVITALGFATMNRRPSLLGLRALIDAQDLTGKPLETSHIVFQIAPCINAVGRLGDPRTGAELLLTDDALRAAELARMLVEANGERRTINKQVELEALQWVEDHCHPQHDYSIVAANQGWHVGVIGIVASRLVESYYRPAIVCSIDKDGMARGSGRSIPGFHLLDALHQCADLLHSYGGHAAAAGLSLPVENIEPFREKFNQVVRQKLSADDLIPTVQVDAAVSIGALTPKMMRILSRMKPFGPGNARPVFVCRAITNKYPPRVVGNNHLKLCVAENGCIIDAIGFNFADRFQELAQAESFSLAFSLDENEWNGRVSLQMKIKGVEL
jgi:single-stranded-DNA-specific exonuclease